MSRWVSRAQVSQQPPTHKLVWSFFILLGRIVRFHTVIKISNMFVKLLVLLCGAARICMCECACVCVSDGEKIWRDLRRRGATYKLTFWLPTGAANDQRHFVPSSLRWSSSSSSSSEAAKPTATLTATATEAATALWTSFHVYDPSTRAIKLYTNKRNKDQKPCTHTHAHKH